MQSEDNLIQPARIFPDITINGINPFYRVETAYNLFDQSELEPHERFFPLLRFQETGLILSTLYRFISIAAPSQGGKTTLAELLAVLIAYEWPGSTVLILSTINTQSERLLRDIKRKLIGCCTVPELRVLKQDSVDTIELAEGGSIIKALPHSLEALTGNPSQFVILDEVSLYTKQPDQIVTEAVARTGQTGGSVMQISSVRGNGVADPKDPKGYRGNFFYYDFDTKFKRRREPKKNAIAARLTYHVSPFLVKNIDAQRAEMASKGRGHFEEHYLSQPRKAQGTSVFAASYKPEIHKVSDAFLANLLDPYEPLFLCFDPGLNKAAVLGQLDPRGPRLMYLRCYMGDREQIFKDFCSSVLMQVKREFGAYGLLYFMDVAARKQNDLTNTSALQVLTNLVGTIPITQYQPVEPGIDVMESFMRQVGAFYVSEKAPILHDAFDSGLVREIRAGVEMRAWKKDGYYEHPGDAARYPVYYLTGGNIAEQLDTMGAYEVAPNPHANRFTGY